MLKRAVKLEVRTNHIKWLLDIINCVYAVSALYRTSNQRAMKDTPELYENNADHIKYIDLSKYVDIDDKNDLANFNPNFSHAKYLDIREEVLQAEQHLLRVADFDTRNEHKKGYLMLYTYLDYLDWNTTATQLAVSVFNDLVFLEISKIHHTNSDEFFQKIRRHIFASIRASYIIGSQIMGLTYEYKIDDDLLDKFCIDKNENLAMAIKILEKYDELYKAH